MTAKFVSAAELMGRVLGADGYRFVTIPHPISSAGRAELADSAAVAAVGAVEILTATDQLDPTRSQRT